MLDRILTIAIEEYDWHIPFFIDYLPTARRPLQGPTLSTSLIRLEENV